MIPPSRWRLIAVGRLRRPWLIDGVEFYRRRLPGLEMCELRDGTPAREAEAIRAALRPDERLVALAEEGESLDSAAFARALERRAGDRLAFVIGGADGLDPAVKAGAAWRLSLSPLTLPHDLARLLLVEQLYRARTILAGGPYHRA